MQSQRFEQLSERLLRAGIRPRHVRRYLAELRDHWEDAVREEEARGSGRGAAEHAAWARLGDDNALVASALARPELRALAVRYPWVVFGLGPVLGLAASMLALLIVLMASAVFVKKDHADVFFTSVAASCFLSNYVLPLVVGAFLMIAAARQRVADAWPMLGIAVTSIVGGLYLFTATPPAEGVPGELMVDITHFADGGLRLVANAVVLGALYLLAKRMQSAVMRAGA